MSSSSIVTKFGHLVRKVTSASAAASPAEFHELFLLPIEAGVLDSVLSDVNISTQAAALHALLAAAVRAVDEENHILARAHALHFIARYELRRVPLLLVFALRSRFPLHLFVLSCLLASFLSFTSAF
jgi:hypothetical protein